jgi:hypothetical protein
VGLANLGSESETCVGSRVDLVGASISFENNFYRLPFTPPTLWFAVSVLHPTREAGIDPPRGRGGDPPRGRAPASIRLEAMAATRLEVAAAGRELRGGREVAPGRRALRELRCGGGSGRELRLDGGSGDRPRGTEEGGDRVGFGRGRGGWLRGELLTGGPAK